MKVLETNPAYNNYLLYIFAHIEGEPLAQQFAGYSLKNNVLRHWLSLPSMTQEYIKTALPQLIAHPNSQISTILGAIMSSVLRRGGITAWPQLLSILTAHLDSSDANTVTGALRALLIICEDCGAELDSADAGRPITVILPKLLPFLRAPNARMRQLALGCVNFCVHDAPLVLLANIDSYLEGLFALVGDESPKVRLLVCEAFVRLTDSLVDRLVPHMDGIVRYIIHSSQDADDRVALAATEFWFVFFCFYYCCCNKIIVDRSAVAPQRAVCSQFVLPHLPTLLPVLVIIIYHLLLYLYFCN